MTVVPCDVGRRIGRSDIPFWTRQCVRLGGHVVVVHSPGGACAYTLCGNHIDDLRRRGDIDPA